MSGDPIYTEMIIEYSRNPSNYGKLENPQIIRHDSNPLCGDSIDLYLNINDNKISDIKLLLPNILISNFRKFLFLENKPKKDSLALLDSINFTKFSKLLFASDSFIFLKLSKASFENFSNISSILLKITLGSELFLIKRLKS